MCAPGAPRWTLAGVAAALTLTVHVAAYIIPATATPSLWPRGATGAHSLNRTLRVGGMIERPSGHVTSSGRKRTLKYALLEGICAAAAWRARAPKHQKMELTH